MDNKKYHSKLINANFRASAWMAVTAFLLLSNLMLSYFVVTADTTEKTMLVPLSVEKEFSVKGNELSQSYVEQMSKQFAHLLLTYHKRNAQSQFDAVLRYTDPAVYGLMKNRFALDYERIARHDISSVFFPMSIHIKQNTAYLTGELNGFIGSQLVNREQKTFKIQFNYNGQLTLIGFNEVIKDSVGEYQALEEHEDVMISSPTASPIEDAAQLSEKKEGKSL